jgi:predicted dithiol-disulfide oxidoreductase (DUF899 family)
MPIRKAQMKNNPVVSQEEWLAARKKLLAKEKELTRLGDQLSAERRALPWIKVEKNYVFDGPNGKESLSDLFEGRSQLIVYHFMYGPGREEGCPGCSFLCDHVDGALIHLAHRDVTWVAVSRGELHELNAFKKRMGWNFKWVSSYGSDFNFDYHVSFTKEDEAKNKAYYNFEESEFALEELSGISVFYKDESDNIFHTYSAYSRGGEVLIGTYNYLDLVPKGRDEDGFEFPMAWMRHHDRYDDYVLDSKAQYKMPEKISSCCSEKE